MHIHILMTEPPPLLWTLFLTRCSKRVRFSYILFEDGHMLKFSQGFLSHTYHPVSSYDPPAGGSTHIHCPLTDLMQESQ